jgi:hypothetical protein
MLFVLTGFPAAVWDGLRSTVPIREVKAGQDYRR